ncbi:MAG: flagellar biosynthetic protein FliQ [Polyangiaceae bacterium]
MLLSPDALIAMVREALLITVAIAVPWVGAMWLFSIALTALLTALQWSDPVLLHAPRVLVGLALLVALGEWMSRPVLDLAARVFVLH